MTMSPERIAQRAAERKEEKRLNKLTSIAHRVEVVDGVKQIILVKLDGCTLEGQVDPVNAQLERMGFRPVRLTRNMLNPNSQTIVIDINTPSYCDPGCESYHSM